MKALLRSYVRNGVDRKEDEGPSKRQKMETEGQDAGERAKAGPELAEVSLKDQTGRTFTGKLEDQEVEQIHGKAVVKAEEHLELFKSTSEDENADGQLFIFVGKSVRGKTHFGKFLLTSMMDEQKFGHASLKFGVAFVKTKYKHSYKFLPDECVFEGYSEAVLKQLVANVVEMLERDGELPAWYIVFDDLQGILGNATKWFTNFIATFRHLRPRIFVMNQYLTGRYAVSPIMREQANAVVMFNSKTENTVINLHKNFGQLFPNRRAFQDYFFAHTQIKDVGKFVAMVYFEHKDEVNENYIPMRAPKNFDEDHAGEVMAEGAGPDCPEMVDEEEKKKRDGQFEKIAAEVVREQLQEARRQERLKPAPVAGPAQGGTVPPVPVFPGRGRVTGGSPRRPRGRRNSTSF
jgi:hypothetical protein